jgi:hypothetical protein
LVVWLCSHRCVSVHACGQPIHGYVT